MCKIMPANTHLCWSILLVFTIFFTFLCECEYSVMFISFLNNVICIFLLGGSLIFANMTFTTVSLWQSHLRRETQNISMYKADSMLGSRGQPGWSFPPRDSLPLWAPSWLSLEGWSSTAPGSQVSTQQGDQRRSLSRDGGGGECLQKEASSSTF